MPDGAIVQLIWPNLRIAILLRHDDVRRNPRPPATFCIPERHGLHSAAAASRAKYEQHGSRDQILSDKADPTTNSPTPAAADAPRRVLSPAAQRALAEAAARRAEADRLAAEAAKNRPHEHQGPKGPEPTRYGDWERNGIASDF
jgi:hypothetical protein